MSDFNNSGMNGKPSTISVTTAWLILAIVILVIIGSFFGYSFFTETLVLNNKEITLWFLFMLFAAAISCFFGAITSHFSQKSDKNKETNMVQEIKSFLTEKTDEITSTVNVALKRSDLVSGDREDIFKLLMSQSLLNGDIKEIRILAHDSSAFSGFFKDHFRNKSFECKKLHILIHDQHIGPDHEIIKKWDSFIRTKTIGDLRIRRAEKRRRSFFGMVIEFERQHPIGMIGFYEPQDEDSGNNINMLNNPYGVFSEEGASILNVLDKYFSHYWDNAVKLREKPQPTE